MDKLNEVLSSLDLQLVLKSRQRSVLGSLLDLRSVLAVLPTGYGKSLNKRSLHFVSTTVGPSKPIYFIRLMVIVCNHHLDNKKA